MAAFRSFEIDWRTKATAFNMLDHMPFGERVYYLLQRYVTKTLPRKLAPTTSCARLHVAHVERMRALLGDIAEIKLMEFGAGWDLYSNLLMYCLGINCQSVLDIRRWAKPEAINSVIKHLQVDPPAGCLRVPTKLVSSSGLEDQLASHYGIHYLAPFDARNTGLPGASIDVIVTTSVLEHIPLPVCAEILAECRRLISRRGIMRHTIDYSDHYSHSDSKISAYNYLSFSDREWQRHNPGIHFQNRARTRDYRDLFIASDFEILEEQEWMGREAELANVTLAGRFRTMSQPELLALGCNFTLRPAGET
jgi:hypothetical protein